MEETSVTEKSHVERFLEHLWKNRKDRGMMADLRHGFSPATAYRAWPHIAQWLGREFTNDRKRTILLTVAAGFAVQKKIQEKEVSGDNLGVVFHQIATGDGRGKDGLATFDTRFRRFLSCSTAQEVCDHLPGVLRTAERKDIPVDFARLHRDLSRWDRWGDEVKVEWARDYWGAPRDEDQHADDQETS